MKFYAEPNLHVRFTDKHRRMFKAIGFSFNDKGEYETDDPLLTKLLAQRFRHENNTESAQIKPENTVQPSETIDEPKTRHCKKCDFTCDNQGDLLAHYRKEHPKGDSAE